MRTQACRIIKTAASRVLVKHMRNDKNDVSEEDSRNNMSPSLYAKTQEMEALK